MDRQGDTKTRAEVSETVERSSEDMREKGDDLEKVAADVATVRETLESLEFGGTAEGSEAVEISIRGAEDVTTEVFDREDGELQEVHAGAEGFQDELQENSSSVDADLERISDAGGELETQETVNELVKAKDAALHDIDFLQEQISAAREAREESERAREEYRQEVHGKGGN